MGATFLPFAIVLLIHLPYFAAAYTWKLETPPVQCANFTISVSGSDGKPPYRVLLVPTSRIPDGQQNDPRDIVDQSFFGEAKSVSLQLEYPAGSRFVAVVSDATGFNSGGTSTTIEVGPSADSACFDAGAKSPAAFFFNTAPTNQILQCTPTTSQWVSSVRFTSTPDFLGIILGGQSFTIPQSQITDVDSQGTGFSWTPSLRSTTDLIIVGGDSRGNGTGGRSFFSIKPGPNNCINDLSPSSTAGSPAGAPYTTGTSITSTSSSASVGGSVPTNSLASSVGSHRGGPNIGAIVGGVVGGVSLVIMVVLLILLNRRSRNHKKPKIDLIDSDIGHETYRDAQGKIESTFPGRYLPVPFSLPPSTVASTYSGEFSDVGPGSDRPFSGHTMTSRSGTLEYANTDGSSSLSGTGRKGLLRQMRSVNTPVNIIQHDDAGPSKRPTDRRDVQTIELPPAYTNIQQ
ncbi:hypothetical protein FPV67DRAFT_1417268 [Lyophyllum atratum]|nr:hypothetical protein FPV67DRAFT_1417268 [Lyophyllum atratum]